MKKIMLLCMLIACYGSIYSQQTIRGTILNSSSQGIPFASVYFPELLTGTETDTAGKFTITIPGDGEATMQVSHIGYKTMLMKVSGKEPVSLTLTNSQTDVEEVVITAPGLMLPENHPYSIQAYSREKLERTGGLNLMTQLAYKPGIDKISTGTWINKPVIRGNSFNRIVLQTMGTRIENQQWDDRHDLGVSEAGIEKVEVVQGPAALMYGADALGGALIFIDEKPALLGKSQGDVSLGYNINNNGINFDIGYKGTSQKGLFYIIRAATSLNGSYKQGGDAPEESPVGKYAANSKYIDATGKATIGVSKSWGTSRINYSYYKQQIGIVEIEPEDSAVEGEEEQRKYEMEPPFQDISSHILSWQNAINMGSGRIYADVAYQYNDRIEYEPLNNGIKHAKYKFIGLKLNVGTYDIRWVSNTTKKAGITIGTQGMFQQNRNNGQETLVPDADVSNYAAYITSRYDLEKINFLAGIRGDFRNVLIKKRIPEDQVFYFPAEDTENDYTPVTGSIGLAWNPLNDLTIKFNAASGFSAPNYAELGTYGRHEGAYRYEIGNPDLEMEQNIEFDAGINFHKPGFSVHADGFYNAISNYIFIENSGTYIDSLPVYFYQQEDAVLTGGSIGIAIHPVKIPFVEISSDFSFTEGTRTDNNDLPFIPAPKIISNITLQSRKKILLNQPFIDFTVSNYLEQKNVAQYELATGSYNLFDVSTGGNFKLGKLDYNVRVFATNIFDTQYYSHLSLVKTIGIHDMGMNIGFKLGMMF